MTPERVAMVERDREYCIRIAFGGCHYRMLPEDLIAEANLFLVWSAQKWKPERGVQFITYFVDGWRNRMKGIFRGRIKRLEMRQFALPDESRRIGEEESVECGQRSPAAEMERAETLAFLRAIMRELPEHDRQACEMHFGEGLKVADVARKTGRGHEVTRQAVRRFIAKARQKMGVTDE